MENLFQNLLWKSLLDQEIDFLCIHQRVAYKAVWHELWSFVLRITNTEGGCLLRNVREQSRQTQQTASGLCSAEGVGFSSRRSLRIRTPYTTEVQCLQMLGRMEWVELWVALALRDTEVMRMSIEEGWWAIGNKGLLWFSVPFALSCLLKFNIVHQAHLKAGQMDDVTVFEGEEFCGYPRSFCQFNKYSCLLSLGECALQNHNRIQSCGKYLLNS